MSIGGPQGGGQEPAPEQVRALARVKCLKQGLGLLEALPEHGAASVPVEAEDELTNNLVEAFHPVQEESGDLVPPRLGPLQQRARAVPSSPSASVSFAPWPPLPPPFPDQCCYQHQLPRSLMKRSFSSVVLSFLVNKYRSVNDQRCVLQCMKAAPAANFEQLRYVSTYSSLV